MKKVLVYGATGSQQSPVIGILKSLNFEVFAATRSDKNFDRLKASGAIPVAIDMARLSSLEKASKGMDYVSFVIPASLPNPFDGLLYAMNLIDAAKTTNVKHIVWNTSGYFTPGKTGNPMSDVKIDVRGYLEKSGVPYTIIESNIYLENLLAPYTTDYVKTEARLAYPLPADMPVGWIATKDVAAFTAFALGRREMQGKIFRVSGAENLTGKDLADQISKGLGFNLEYYALPPKEFGKIMSSLMDETSAKAIELHYQSIAASAPNYPDMFNKNITTLSHQFGVSMTPVEEWAREYRAIFSS